MEFHLLLLTMHLVFLVEKLSVRIGKLVREVMVVWNKMNSSVLFYFQVDKGFFPGINIEIIPCSHVEVTVRS